jgi:hypothetical protein
MAITVVNGYLCMNGCDAAKARTGQDPHPATDAQRRIASDNNQSNGSNAYGAAVVYGGALANINTNAINPASASTGASTQAANPSVNVLV